MDFGFWISDFGFRILDFGFRIFDFGALCSNSCANFGFRILDLGFWILDFGFWISDFGLGAFSRTFFGRYIIIITVHADSGRRIFACFCIFYIFSYCLIFLILSYFSL